MTDSVNKYTAPEYAPAPEDAEMLDELTALTGDVPLSHRYYELVYAHLPRLLALARLGLVLEAENARLRKSLEAVRDHDKHCTAIMASDCVESMTEIARAALATPQDREGRWRVMPGSATFSFCNRYRYSLTRMWDDDLPLLAFVLLNPSTADASKNDPTVERCERRARTGGYGGLIVLNIFALRSTDPKKLYLSPDPIGPLNDKTIIEMVKKADAVICGWGSHGRLANRGAFVYDMLVAAGVRPLCLAHNACGHPKHPLYVGYSVVPVPYSGPRTS